MTSSVWLESAMDYFIRQQILPILGLLLIIDCIISLELLELRVPAHVPLGTRAQLSCRWQLGPADVLYTVKWYKDGKEFFRHVPRDTEPRRKFPLPGVDVEDSDSSGSDITLAPVVLETAGRYRCEVSGEKPLFPTVSEHADMAVIVLPDRGPVLSGFQSRYRIGDRVRVNCSSGRSHPATKLAWYINGEPAPVEAVTPANHVNEDGLENTSMKLDFFVTEQHFRNNGLKVKCLATLSPIYWRSNEEIALMEMTVQEKSIRSYADENSRADRVHWNIAILLTISAGNIVAVMCCAKVASSGL